MGQQKLGRGLRIVKSSLHNHLRTTNYITAKTTNNAVETASRRLGKGGVFGVISLDPSPTETDNRWQIFLDNLKYDKVSTGNGIYIPEKDILAVNGQEVQSGEGYHVLLIGTTPEQHVRNGTSLERVLDAANKFLVIKGIDHSFYLRGLGQLLRKNPELNNRFHLYESFNGLASLPLPGGLNANPKAQEHFDSIKDRFEYLCEFSSDDGHSCWELGRNYSEIKMPDNYEKFRDAPDKVVSELIEGHYLNRIENLGHKRTPARIGAIKHIMDLAILIGCNKILGWDPNKKTAPFFERLGISI